MGAPPFCCCCCCCAQRCCCCCCPQRLCCCCCCCCCCCWLPCGRMVWWRRSPPIDLRCFRGMLMHVSAAPLMAVRFSPHLWLPPRFSREPCSTWVPTKCPLDPSAGCCAARCSPSKSGQAWFRVPAGLGCLTVWLRVLGCSTRLRHAQQGSYGMRLGWLGSRRLPEQWVSWVGACMHRSAPLPCHEPRLRHRSCPVQSKPSLPNP